MEGNGTILRAVSMYICERKKYSVLCRCISVRERSLFFVIIITASKSIASHHRLVSIFSHDTFHTRLMVLCVWMVSRRTSTDSVQYCMEGLDGQARYTLRHYSTESTTVCRE